MFFLTVYYCFSLFSGLRHEISQANLYKSRKTCVHTYIIRLKMPEKLNKLSLSASRKEIDKQILLPNHLFFAFHLI